MHDQVWDGSKEDPATGLCGGQGRPDDQGRYSHLTVNNEWIKGFKYIIQVVMLWRERALNDITSSLSS